MVTFDGAQVKLFLAHVSKVCTKTSDERYKCNHEDCTDTRPAMGFIYAFVRVVFTKRVPEQDVHVQVTTRKNVTSTIWYPCSKNPRDTEHSTGMLSAHAEPHIGTTRLKSALSTVCKA